jgi:hypothetical protein
MSFNNEEYEEIGDKAKLFLMDLKVLCEKHKIQLAVSGYDALIVGNLENDEPYLWVNGIEDKTK